MNRRLAEAITHYKPSPIVCGGLRWRILLRGRLIHCLRRRGVTRQRHRALPWREERLLIVVVQVEARELDLALLRPAREVAVVAWDKGRHRGCPSTLVHRNLRRID